MKFYTITKKTYSIATQDIAKLLGLEELPQVQKDKLLDDMSKNVIQYFLQEKLGDVLTDERKDEIADKYEKDLDAEKLLQELAEEVPNIAELFADASIEIKAHTVLEYYKKLKMTLEQSFVNELDQSKKDVITKKLQLCNKNLEYIEQDKWESVVGVKESNL